MADIVLSVPSKVAEYLVAPVNRGCGYVIFYNRYVRQLNEEVEKLGDARNRVQHSIDEAQNNMRPIKADVERWVNVAETVANKAFNMLEEDGRAKKTCFCGWLPNPKVRYCLGRDARRTIEDIHALILQGKFENPPLGLVGGAPDADPSAGDGDDTITDSRASIIQGIMEALDDEKLQVIGVYGPGGVGKTTLLEVVEKELRKERRPFHFIVKSTISQTPNRKKIQYDIAYALSLNLKDEPSENGRADLLCRRLQRDPHEKVLIILDDLWDAFDLKAVGIPLGEESRGCKLLLTSRFRDVLEQKMQAGRIFHLEGLKNDEAFRLLKKVVGGNTLEDEKLKQIASEIVKKLAGLPLSIISVARTLKYSSVDIWSGALEAIVKLSYDQLESEEAKPLFLLCGLIGGTIQVETLLVLGIGLGLFEEFNNMIEDSRDRLNIVLNELCLTGLLLYSGDDKDHVTINDLYSELVISTPFEGQNSLMMNSNCGSWSREKLEKCWAICLDNVDSDRLVELMHCRFPKLKILMLFQSKDWYGRPAHRHDEGDCCRLDFTLMKELQVLYLRSMHITRLPSSMGVLENLRTSYLDNCHVEDVAILGKLKLLKILSFVGSTISRLPKEIGELTNLRLLNLSNCKELCIIEPGVLKCLINLEELYMKGSFDRWMGNDEISSKSYNASLAELKSLTKLTTLEISIPDPTVLFKDGDLPFGNLIKFWINIGNVGGREFEGLRNMKLKLGGCDSILSKEWVQKTLQKTQYLHLDGLREFKKNAHELCSQGFSQLKHLNIQNSPSIKYIASSSYDLLLTAFTVLESLFLENLINLEKISHGLVALECFSKLKALCIIKCHLLKNLWFLSEMQKLVHLEEIQACDCDSMQAIIIDDARKVEVAVDDIVELPKVRRLDLHKLPNITSFCIGAEGAPIQVAFPTLETLEITGLDNLRFMFLPSMVKSLAQLRELRVSDCMNMEAIIIEEEGWGMEASETLAFPMLTNLHLQRLKHVTCFSRTKCSPKSRSQDEFISCSSALFNQEVTFPRLETLEITGLDNLGFMVLPSMVKYLAQLRELRVSDCMNMEAIIMEEERWGLEASETLAFPMLNILHLQHLKHLTCFSRTKYSQEAQSQDGFNSCSIALFNQEVLFPSLAKLHITDTGYIKMTWDNHATLSLPRHFQHLKTLDVSHCVELSNMFTPTMAGNLVELTNLRISNCKMLTEIISGEGCKEGPVVAFKQLKSLKLEELIGLTCFSSGRFTLLFPLLEEIEVTKCLNMKFFSEAPLRAPKLNPVPLSTGMWLWNGKIRYGTQDMSIDMATVDEIEFMHLSGFSELMEKWHSKLIPIKSSWQLKSLVVDNCLPFLNAIPSRLMPVLDKINTLQVQDCKSLEEIFDLEGLKATKGTQVLPRLWCLNLVNLPKLRRLWNEDIQGMLCFSSLSYLTLCNCSNLRHAFAPSMARRLPTLQWIAIKNCDQMEGVMAKEEGEMAEEGGEISEVEKIIFPILRCMELEQLPNLTSFFSDTNQTLECPRLQELTIAGCPKIRTFTWQSLMKIDQGISSPFTPQVLFPRVKSMVLSHMDNSSKIRVDANGHLLKVEAFEKLQVEFRVIEETSGLPLHDTPQIKTCPT